jgi:hypothetical protein
MTESVRVAREGSTLVITIDRPSVRNAVDMATALSSWPLWRGSTPMAPCEREYSRAPVAPSVRARTSGHFSRQSRPRYQDGASPD